MATWDVCVLTGSYYMDGDEVVIELFGKTREGVGCVVRYHGFKPYFFIAQPPPEITRELEADNEVIRTEVVPLELDHRQVDCTKVTIKHPFEVPSFRRRYGRVRQVLAADIPFVHRFFYDLDLSLCVTVDGEEAQATDGKYGSPGLDTEPKQRYTCPLVIDATELKKCKLFKPRLKTFSFDIENSIIDDGRLFTICLAVRESGGDQPPSELTTEAITGVEFEIIDKFEEAIQRHDPDVITGYNIDGYDIPQVLRRTKVHGKENLEVGRDMKGLNQVSNRFWRLHGRIIADAWWNVKRELRPKKESLNAVAKEFLGLEKDDVDPKNIDQEWEDDQEKVISYCIKDAELALQLLEMIRIVEKSMDLAAVSMLPLDDALNGRTSNWIDSIFVREADRKGIAVPCTRNIQKEDQIEGGYVHQVSPGLYHWVCVLDFRSMYPSVIIENNICFSTLHQSGSIQSPVGARYIDADTKRGLMPEILEKLMDDRLKLKKKMRAAENDSQKIYYDGLQAAVKILMNSFYGVFASSFYRFTNPLIGESITAFARENIKRIISQLGEEGLSVIYSDTDSVFFLSPEAELDATVKFGTDIADRFSEGYAVLEFEKIMEPFFTHGKKKRYVGKVVWPNEEILVRGYETRRTDSFDLQSESLNQMFELVLSDKIDEAVKFAQEVVKKVKLGRVEPHELVISKGTKPESAYKNPDKMANVQAMKKLVALGYEFVPGMKVSFIVIDSKRSPQLVEPFIDGHPFDHEPDHDYYAARLAHTLSRVTDIFGYDEKRLLTGAMQADLFSDRFQEEAAVEMAQQQYGDTLMDELINMENEKNEPKKAKKKDVKREEGTASLEDFF